MSLTVAVQAARRGAGATGTRCWNAPMPNPPIIFLDMDGVLSSARAFLAQQHRANQEDRWIDRVAVRYLNMLCAEGKARVVVSSVWRLTRSRASFLALLRRHAFTGHLHRDWRTKQIPSAIRGDEVREWMDRHPEVERHLILDDDSDFHGGQPLVQTDGRDGFLYRHLQQAFEVLCPGDQQAMARASRRTHPDA